MGDVDDDEDDSEVVVELEANLREPIVQRRDGFAATETIGRRVAMAVVAERFVCDRIGTSDVPLLPRRSKLFMENRLIIIIVFVRLCDCDNKQML